MHEAETVLSAIENKNILRAKICSNQSIIHQSELLFWTKLNPWKMLYESKSKNEMCHTTKSIWIPLQSVRCVWWFDGMRVSCRWQVRWHCMRQIWNLTDIAVWRQRRRQQQQPIERKNPTDPPEICANNRETKIFFRNFILFVWIFVHIAAA